jgi:hypothetical protein
MPSRSDECPASAAFTPPWPAKARASRLAAATPEKARSQRLPGRRMEKTERDESDDGRNGVLCVRKVSSLLCREVLSPASPALSVLLAQTPCRIASAPPTTCASSPFASQSAARGRNARGRCGPRRTTLSVWPRATGVTAGHDLLQNIQVDRLNQVRIEAGRSSVLDIFGLPVTG